MTPILHRGADTTLPELERLLGLELRFSTLPTVTGSRRSPPDCVIAS